MGTIPLVRDVIIDQVFYLMNVRASAFGSTSRRYVCRPVEGEGFTEHEVECDGKGALYKSYRLFPFLGTWSEHTSCNISVYRL